jgi:hypothetical protein
LFYFFQEGYRGAMLQTLATRMALEGISVKAMADRLVAFADGFGETDEEGGYAHAMRLARDCLDNCDDVAALRLGNDVTALKSVPSAIYSYLRARKSAEGLDEKKCAFTRTIQGRDSPILKHYS